MLASARWGLVIIVHEQCCWTSCCQGHECRFHYGIVVVPPTSSQVQRPILCGGGEVLLSFALLDCNPRAPSNILSVVSGDIQPSYFFA
ncbi:hypothetical protein EDD17DRAFT_1646193 [Pisolithus thermaeus]|nr:hypothetical protein EDD17DRAFT_1646193 [Pisolithus thermaeus]